MTAKDLIFKLRGRGVRLSVSGDRIDLEQPSPGTIAAVDVAALKALKSDVIDLLADAAERASIIEVEGEMSADAAEQRAWEELMEVRA